MNLCVHGHDKAKVGIDVNGQCRQCRRDQNKARAAERRRREGRPAFKEGMCRNGKHPKAETGPCKPCQAENRKRYLKNRADRGLPPPPSRDTISQPADGWEDEFGPVPFRVLDRYWYDPVIVRRALLGYPTGRVPYRLEQAEIVRRLPPEMTGTELARWCGVEIETACAWIRNGENGG